MRRFMVALLVVSALSACGVEAPTDDELTASSQQELLSDSELVAAFASLHQVGTDTWTFVVRGHPVVLTRSGAVFRLEHPNGHLIYVVESVAIRSDLEFVTNEDPPPETSALKAKWLGKLIKAIADLFDGGHVDATGANGCQTQARLTCGEGCVESANSTIISCKVTCKSGGGCGGGL